MDKSWMNIANRKCKEYETGVENFIRFACSGKDEKRKIPCPCTQCNNFRDQAKDIVKDHLLRIGIRKSYVRWIYHGEAFEDDSDFEHTVDDDFEQDSDEDNDMNGLLNDIGIANWGDNWMDREEVTNQPTREKESEADKFLRLVKDAREDLYPGCEHFSKLAFIVTLLHLKTMSGWTIKSFDALLGVFKNALPTTASIPKSYHEAKKIIRELGFNYEKIHACVNDCVLFRKQYEGLDTCPNEKCKEPRYKTTGSKVPRKVLRYFPLKPRLQRLYINKDIACDMRWHKEKSIPDENIMRHPVDSEAWKHLDNTYPDFALDPRNIRLGLATDGFNPFGSLSNVYSIWPVFVVPYNLPPWKCMKDPFFILSMLIPGPKSPGNDIDVYLQPFIDEANELWIGIQAYDAYAEEKFLLRAALLWTIHDFPAYAMVSGWSTKGYGACPICMSETSCFHLRNYKKLCYTGHRRFLPLTHKWRKDKKQFDGKVDFRNPILPLSGTEILEQLDMLQHIEVGKAPDLLRKRKRKHRENGSNWTKKSVFFELPYWSKLRIRHNVDIMHVAKNVSESLFATIMSIGNRTKDTWQAREDLKELGIKKDLHLIRQGKSYIMPVACYALTQDEKRKICNFLTSIKYPDGFASNISRCVKNGQLQMAGMKSHDFHVFIQRILPLAIRGCLTKEVRQLLFELSDFFKKLCSRTLYMNILEEQEKNIVVILCKLERLFPPSFFDIMVHLMVHLPTEAKIAGPPQYRWMFPFERKMGTLKSYVSNRARPEGCIAERYIDNECMVFCSLYLQNVETIFNKVERNNEKAEPPGELSIFCCKGRPFGGAKDGYLTESDWAKVHIFVLNNCDEIEDYIIEHKQKLEMENYENVDQRHDKQFPKWFQDRVLYGSEKCKEEIRSLAMGPDKRIKRYTGCMVNGYRFHTKDREKERKTQNSGVVVKGEHGNNTIDFYGVVKDIFEVCYMLGRKTVLIFMCDWFKVGDNSGIQLDKEWQMTSINMSRKWYQDQPFVLACQVDQVFYVEDMKLGKNWFVVERFSPRNLYDVPEKLEVKDAEQAFQEEVPNEVIVVMEADGQPSLAREDSDTLQFVDSSVVDAINVAAQATNEDFIDDDDIMDADFTSDRDENEDILFDDETDQD